MPNANSNIHALSAHQVFYEYPDKKALSDVSLSIEAGTITALVGPNGAGKSTLMRCLAALDSPFSGDIHINGINAQNEPRKVHSVLGYLSDFFGLYDSLTVRQCLTYAAWSRLIPDSYVSSHIDWLIDLLGLEGVIDQKAGTLSRGWRQRLGIAQAIIHNPKILILDEPASGLDPESRHKLSGILKKLRDEKDMTILVSSHILAELEDYCDSMLILRNGQLVDHVMAGAAPSQGTATATDDGTQISPIYLDLSINCDTAKATTALIELGATNIDPQNNTEQRKTKNAELTRLHCDIALPIDNNSLSPLIKKIADHPSLSIEGFGRRTTRLQDIYLTRSEENANEMKLPKERES